MFGDLINKLKKSDYTIERKLLINVATDKIFPYINNSKLANEWMPWAEMDSAMIMSYEGPQAGVGSISSWHSTGKMGVGSAQVIESVENKFVKTKLVYEKPMQMVQIATISLLPQENATLVQWQVSGKNTFMGRLFCLFINMDKMVGGEFEKGLHNLKKKVEM